MKTLIGLCTFGNLDFTKLAVRGIMETLHREADILGIVGMPGDMATVEYLAGLGIASIRHTENMGFPYALNDLYDVAFNGGGFDALICMGNDVVPYPNAINTLIDVAEAGTYEWLCACQFDVQSLCERYPEARLCFDGPDFKFTDFKARPWELHWPNALREMEGKPVLGPEAISDVRNLALFKRSVFDEIGYADANFWPGGYFEDNDYCRRGRLAGLRAATLPHAAYFHFWSRTIHQQGGSTTPKTFERNRAFYQMKWGGPFDAEKFAEPFNGLDFPLNGNVTLRGAVKIDNRNFDGMIARHWRNL